ncbi:hypothetical protein F4680DRAFT_450171 [Xylaria scruposa]|nr:hypothetical protein F4680DRAFT_450171 [Xylaria scruposa]
MAEFNNGSPFLVDGICASITPVLLTGRTTNPYCPENFNCRMKQPILCDPVHGCSKPDAVDPCEIYTLFIDLDLGGCDVLCGFECFELESGTMVCTMLDTMLDNPSRQPAEEEVSTAEEEDSESISSARTSIDTRTDFKTLETTVFGPTTCSRSSDSSTSIKPEPSTSTEGARRTEGCDSVDGCAGLASCIAQIFALGLILWFIW